MALQPTSRREVLLAAGATVSTFLAGCSEVRSQLPGDDGDDEDGDGEDENDGDERDAYRSAIEDYLEAAAAADTAALGEEVHPESPMAPEDWEDSDWEFQSDPYEDAGTVEVEDVTTDVGASEVYALESVEFWFETEDDLASALEGEDVVLVEADVDGLDLEDGDLWVLATADDDWRVFFVTTRDDTPDDPEEALEDPIHDEDGDVVADVDWSFEQEDVDGAKQEYEWARVDLTDSPGVEADTVRIESTVAGYEIEFYDESTGGNDASWADSWAAVQLDPDGDQIVVTAVDDGEETVVHREHYEP